MSNLETEEMFNKDSFSLKDFLSLTPDEIRNSKIGLSMTADGIECIKLWQEDGRVGYSYWSHQGTWKGEGHKLPNKNIHKGNVIFGFVRLGNDRWLLVTVGRILDVPEITIDNPSGGHCDYEIIDKYRPLFGKLIVKLRKGDTYARYVFNLSKYLDTSYIEQILPSKYGSVSFPGYSNININFKELSKQIENLDWRSKLEAVNGIYLITDDFNNKKYVGSAYGVQGIYGRWRTYLDNGYVTDDELSGNKFPNTQLKKIATDKAKGIEYINKYFRFSILETVPSNFSKNDVIERENHWKEILKTRNKDFGYNSN